ncbi:MAG: 3-hydroxybutyryl-CoA dehydrogenase [Alphaproteobacteria bacterium]|nr:3-hydroxybutyryl-CoA dehydrogenase [Alphaproteobacteria bacterium]
MIKTLAIIGAGQMGAGIAHICAVARYTVYLIDTSQNQLDKAFSTIKKNLERQVTKGTLTPELHSEALKNLHLSLTIDKHASIDLVIEAVAENLELKSRIFKELDHSLPAPTLLASNTSSLSITQIASATMRPDRVIGMHFMNPPPLMPLVEVIRGEDTSDATYSAIHAMILHLGKTPVTSQDAPGFIVNRILMPMINEAIYALHEGIASPEDIDTAMKLGTHQPMGPLALADFIGLDTCLSIMQVLHQGFQDDKYRPCPLLVKYVNAGRLGKKTGHGFFEYPA